MDVTNNLAYTGTSGFRNATLGVYVEWWLSFTEINGRYTEAKRQFEHYSMEEAVRVLSGEKE